MRKEVPRVRGIRIAIAMIGFIFAASCMAQTTQALTSKQPESIKRFLRDYLGEPDPSSEQEVPTRYSYVFVDLNNHGEKEIIVYVTGRNWCGTAGCTMLVLAREGTSYKLIARVSAVRLPIWVLDRKSNGWRDIGILVRPSGVEPLYEAIISFDGKTYPVGSARRSQGKVQQVMVMPATTKGKPLYQ
jgi:putative lipoprotein